MSNSISQAKSEFEQIKREASELLKARMRGEVSACERIRKSAPRFAKASDAAILASSSVIDTLEAVSRERGFASWHAVQEAGQGHKMLPGNASLEYLKKQAKKLLKAHQAGNAEVVERIAAHGTSGGEFTLNDAQFVVAREYGIDSWPKLVAGFATDDDRTTFNRYQLYAVEQMHEKCRQQLGDVFTRHLREQAVCDTAFIDQTTYAEFIHSLAMPSCMCSFSVDAMRSRSVLDIAMPLTSAILCKGATDKRWLTDEEKQRMQPVFAELLTVLQRAWETVMPTVVGGAELATDPEMVKVNEASALVILVAFEINTLERSGLLSISYPLPEGIIDLRAHFDK